MLAQLISILSITLGQVRLGKLALVIQPGEEVER